VSQYSPSEIEDFIAKAKNATKNALWSIERAYLPPCQGAPAAFILITCLIDFLGTLYAGGESEERTFRTFVSDFMKRTYNGVGYDDKELYRSLRNKLVHNYSIWRGKYVLTHGHPDRHLELHNNKARILNLENFFNDIKKAADDYFAQVDQDAKLKNKLANRISKFGTIEDIEI